jgi:hypothetical protein
MTKPDSDLLMGPNQQPENLEMVLGQSSRKLLRDSEGTVFKKLAVELEGW